MFIELSKLINLANLARLNLNIQPSTDNRMSVIVTSTPIIGGEVKDEKLRQSLTGELRLEGTVSELEDGFIQHLASFSESYIEKSLIANTNEVVGQHSEQVNEPETSKQSIENALDIGSKTETNNVEPDSALSDWS